MVPSLSAPREGVTSCSGQQAQGRRVWEWNQVMSRELGNEFGNNVRAAGSHCCPSGRSLSRFPTLGRESPVLSDRPKPESSVFRFPNTSRRGWGLHQASVGLSFTA